MSAKDIRDLIRQYERAGFRVERKRQHNKVFSPAGQLVAVLPSSPCKGRAGANAQAWLRKVLREHQVVAA